MTWVEISLFVMAVLVMIAGLSGTLLPILPGLPLIFIAALAFAALTDFVYVDGSLIGIFAVLTGVGLLLDWLAQIVGVKRMGGTWAGVVGSFVGMLVGLALPGIGIVGFVVGAFLGALAGELLMTGDTRQAIRAGSGSFLGFILGGVTRFVIGTVMIGWFAWAVLF